MRKRGFTLIEVLVVTAVIALLVGILLPSLMQARAQGRRAVCLANLRQLAVATTGYLDENRDYFWRYYVDTKTPKGRGWWFGFEPNGPASGRHRPLDKRRAAVARYLRSTDDALQCPDFPYSDGAYYPKFTARSASYGYNLVLGPATQTKPTRRRAEYRNRSAEVFVFADGIHFDFNPGINEGHYLQYAPDPANPAAKSGYAHFRHAAQAHALFMDGHVSAQRLLGPAYPGLYPGGSAGNLSGPGQSNSVYGN